MGEGGERRIGKGECKERREGEGKSYFHLQYVYCSIQRDTHFLRSTPGAVEPNTLPGAAWECLSHECVRAVHLLTSPAPVGRYCASCVLYVCALTVGWSRVPLCVVQGTCSHVSVLI